MLLSIIVPVYNTEQFLPKCIDSILGQTFREFEIILVDDGSTDGSLAICREYEAKDNRIRVIHKENGGLISAKKVGLEHSKGDYVGFVDSDDWVAPFMYQKLVGQALECNADIAIADNVVVQGKREICVKQGFSYGVYDKERLVNEVYPNLAFKDKLYTLGVSPSLCTKIFRKELVKEYQLRVDERIKGGEDASCTYPAIMAAQRVVYVEDNWGYFYRVHKESMTHKRKRLQLEERVLLLDHIHTQFNTFKYECVERQIALYSLSVIEQLVMNYFENGVRTGDSVMGKMLETIIKHPTWNLIQSQCIGEELPDSTRRVMAYICSRSKIDAMYVRSVLKRRQYRTLVKTLLIKLKLCR